MKKEELNEKLQSLRRELNSLHDRIIPVEMEFKRLTKQYESLWKEYDALDRELAKIDGRHRKVAITRKGHTHSECVIREAIEKLTFSQLDMIIKQLEKKLKGESDE